MLAYHNDNNLKQSVLAEMRDHKEADELVQGYGYWEDGKGCAVGCLIKGNDHQEYESKFGIPAQLARLEDSIFEGLPKELAQQWPERFLGAIKVGADLSRVWSEFAYWLLTDKEHGQIVYANGDARVIDAIMGVAKLHKEVISGKRKGRWSAARSAADSAAESAADSAAWSAAWSAAESAAHIRMADKLIEILENAPATRSR